MKKNAMSRVVFWFGSIRLVSVYCLLCVNITMNCMGILVCLAMTCKYLNKSLHFNLIDGPGKLNLISYNDVQHPLDCPLII